MRHKFDSRAAEQLSRCIQQVEAGSDAELVIDIRRSSGSYAHADARFGALLAFAALLFFFFSPIVFTHAWIAADVAIIYFAGVFISSRSHEIRRAMTSAASRRLAARNAAAALFCELGIANTERETGMLVYFSLLERQVEVLADRGVLKAVPPTEWNAAVDTLRHATSGDPEELIAAIGTVGTILAKHLPATGENRDELASTPRIEIR